MPIVEIKIEGFQCERCGHKWVPRDIQIEPRVCPKCKSPYWNIKRRPKVESK
jgi:predicted Zn-ribbon and HTH transcriptional regulator